MEILAFVGLLFTSIMISWFVRRVFRIGRVGVPRPPVPTDGRGNKGETWGGARMQVPSYTLPTDPNSIPIPEMFKTPAAPPAPTAAPDPYSAPPPDTTDPYAPLDTPSAAPSRDTTNKAEKERRLAELESYRQQGIIDEKEYKKMRRDILRGR